MGSNVYVLIDPGTSPREAQQTAVFSSMEKLQDWLKFAYGTLYTTKGTRDSVYDRYGNVVYYIEEAEVDEGFYTHLDSIWE